MSSGITCGVCFKAIDAPYPSVGDSVVCPNCGAEGYGTYSSDEYMNYEMEWIEPELNVSDFQEHDRGTD